MKRPTTREQKLITAIAAAIEMDDYSEPCTYVDLPAWARACGWSVALTRGVYGALVRDGYVETDVAPDSLGATRAAELSGRDGGYSGSIPTCWFPKR